jgi:hypothetical protein
LTPEERAEKILEWIDGFCSHFPTGRCLKCRKEGIAAEIRAAVEEAEAGWNQVRSCDECKQEAYEDAAGLIEAQIVWTPDGVQRLGEKIRARAKETK